MRKNQNDPHRLTTIWRAMIEIVFIVFLFFSNLLMGEFTAVNGKGKTVVVALNNIFTAMNLVIAILAASIGYVAFEYLRKRL
jgi:hypothetical protein